MSIKSLKKIRKTFPQKQALVLEEVIEVVDQTVKVSDFNELKSIVADISVTLKEIVETQKRTETRLEELAQAQAKTEIEVRTLTKGLNQLRKEFGGFTRSVSYGFENEAYRNFPRVLHQNYGIDVIEKFIRTDIDGEEINFFARAKQSGKEILIIGEAKLRLDEVKRDFERTIEELERKVRIAKEKYPALEVKRLIVTHFAKKTALKEAEKRGLIVIQSFEW